MHSIFREGGDQNYRGGEYMVERQAWRAKMKKRMEPMDWWEQKMGHHTNGMGGGRGRIEEKRDGKRNEIVLRIRRLWDEMKH